MGYTHYWRIVKDLNPDNFKAVVKDFRKLLPLFKSVGVQLRDWNGEPNKEPELTEEIIAFNGNSNTGNPKRDLGITWPADNATGVCMTYQKGKTTLKDSDINGKWFAGLKLNQRTCGADGSHESFILHRNIKPEDWQKPEKGKYFQFCKTAYKPYDLAVNCALIIAKHHLKEQIVVSSDGELNHWSDAMKICQKILGYGQKFQLEE